MRGFHERSESIHYCNPANLSVPPCVAIARVGRVWRGLGKGEAADAVAQTGAAEILCKKIDFSEKITAGKKLGRKAQEELTHPPIT